MEQIKSGSLRTVWFSMALLVLYLILVPASARCKSLSKQQVEAAVQTWVRHVTADARPDAVIERMEPYQVNGETVAYIAHLEGGGFCLCGADDLVVPVYLYNPKGSYDPQNPNYQYILWEISTRLNMLQKGIEEEDTGFQRIQEALLRRSLYWADLMTGRVPERMEEPEDALSGVTLNLTPQWHQKTPYNDQCPLHVPASRRTVVGCVATAMAQIMYYWKWPETGVGQSQTIDYNYRWRTNWDRTALAKDPEIPSSWSSQLVWTTFNGGSLWMNGNWDGSVYGAASGITDFATYQNALAILYSRLNSTTTQHAADFGAATYDWGLLKDLHDPPDTTSDAEVAKLCSHAGLSVDMDYGIYASGAWNEDVPDALEDHFRYDQDGTCVVRDVNAMVEEIQWLRPLEISGATPFPDRGAHAWVIYGYNKETYPWQFVMNMGWGPASSHVLYSCDELFSLSQKTSIRLAPRDVVGFVGDDDPGDGSPDDPYEDIEEAVALADPDTTLIFKAGSVNTFSTNPLVINKKLTLRGHRVFIRKE